MPANIPEEIIDRIKDRLNIVDIVSEYVALKKVGANHKGLCPFHSEKTPSFTVNEGKQIFHCFGCGEGGNVFTFVMKAAGLTFPDAVRELAGKAGVEIPRHETETASSGDDKRETLYRINETAASFYSALLKGSERARQYIEKRGLSGETIGGYNIGYAGDEWDSLSRYFIKKGVPMPFAAELGLIVPKKNGSGYYDRFRGRITFPIFDISGRVTGFGGRSMDGSEPKYLNSPESVLYRKSESLYGLHVARRWIREADEALVVEGYMDLLALHQAGIRNAVATLGTALTTGHLSILKRLTNNIVTVFDADQAGVKATIRSLDLFLSEGMRGRVLHMTGDHDPDTYIREVGAESFRDAARSAAPIMEFFINSVSKGLDMNSMQGRLRLTEEALPYLARVTNRIEQGHYLKILSEKAGIKEELLLDELKKGGGGPAPLEVRLKKTPVAAGTQRAEKRIISLSLRHPELREVVAKSNILDTFQDEALRGFGKRLMAASPDDDLLEHFTGDDKRLYLELIIEEDTSLDPSRELEDCTTSLISQVAKRERERLRRDMQEAAKAGDEVRLRELAERFKGMIS